LLKLNSFIALYFLSVLTVISLKAQDNSLILESSYVHDDNIYVVLNIFDYTKLKNVTNLELNSNASEIPAGVFKLSSIEELTVNSDDITSIPADIRKLYNLRTLNLSNTSVTSLPKEMEQLLLLKELHLPYNYWVYRLDEVKKITKAKVILE